MGCCGIKGDKEGEEDDKRARKQNKEIEKQIQKDKQVISASGGLRTFTFAKIPTVYLLTK